MPLHGGNCFYEIFALYGSTRTHVGRLCSSARPLQAHCIVSTAELLCTWPAKTLCGQCADLAMISARLTRNTVAPSATASAWEGLPNLLWPTQGSASSRIWLAEAQPQARLVTALAASLCMAWLTAELGQAMLRLGEHGSYCSCCFLPLQLLLIWTSCVPAAGQRGIWANPALAEKESHPAAAAPRQWGSGKDRNKREG